MSRIFWDTMLFVYLLEDNKQFAPQVRKVLARSYERGDTLTTSYLALGEVMAGESPGDDTARTARAVIEEMGFAFLNFDGRCVDTFSRMRSKVGLKAPDAIHIACAAAAGSDLFLTSDTKLLSRRLHVQGIQFIVDLMSPIL